MPSNSNLTNNPQKNIMFVAAEASGDKHGAQLIKQLKLAGANAHYNGVGSTYMQAEGMDSLFDLTPYAVIGLIDVFTHLRTYKKVMTMIIKKLKDCPPDLLILIDSPGFNLRLAEKAKALGITVVYYISPQIWAWKPGRIKKIKACVDLMAVILPFEEAIYQQANVPVVYTGNPLIEEINATQTREDFLSLYKISPSKRLIGVLPGSRKKEISRLLPVMLEAAKSLYRENPDLHFILPLAKTTQQSEIAVHLQALDTAFPITIVENNTHNAVKQMHCAMVCSGTATLEAALLNTPCAIIYRSSFVTYLILFFALKTKYIGLPNILANRMLFPELVHVTATAKHLHKEITRYIKDETYYAQTKADLIGIEADLTVKTNPLPAKLISILRKNSST